MSIFDGDSDTGPTTGQAAGMQVFSTALSSYNTYEQSQHEEPMAQMNWQHNRKMVLINSKVNDYITNRNRLLIEAASGDKKVAIQFQEMQQKAAARVTHATIGSGMTQAVIHDISRAAQVEEGARLAELDANLEANKMQKFSQKSSEGAAIGMKPIDSVSPGLAVLGFAGSTLSIGNQLEQDLRGD